VTTTWIETRPILRCSGQCHGQYSREFGSLFLPGMRAGEERTVVLAAEGA